MGYALDYFNDLCDYIDGNKYRDLLWELFATDYIYYLDADRGREEDALYYVRGRFKSGKKLPEQMPVTVLEVLIAMSYRCEHDIMGTKGDDNFYEWFWIFMENWGMMEFRDGNFDEKEVKDKISGFLSGKNAENPFFCKKLKKGGTNGTSGKLGIWIEMSQFLSENFL